MADVRPFRGVTFDPGRVDLAKVLCPPYDVISPPDQEAYYRRDPHNAVRVVLNRAQGHARYTVAASELRAWLSEGTLRRDQRPAFYVHRHRFGVASRLGLLAAVRVEPWSTRAVLPHEHTMPGPKEDRLRLMQETGADTEPIWVFHPDPGAEMRGRLSVVTERPPDLAAEFTPEGGDAEAHELWRVDAPADVEAIAAAASALQLYMADGHHRYETALHHADASGGGPDDATRFKLMLLTGEGDPGLVLLPTHRIVRLPDGVDLAAARVGLSGLGWIDERMGTLAEVTDRLAQPPGGDGVGFGLVTKDGMSYLEGEVPGEHVEPLPPSVAALDVALVHEGVLRPLLGIGPEALAEGKLVAYARDAREVVDRVAAGDFDLGLLLRPPTLAQVKAVADAGESMPQKSTYFWPKPASGLIMALQPPGESL